MASIKSQMALDDGVSRVLNKIVSALDQTLSSFEQVQRASGQAFDVAEINQARLALVGASSDLQNIATAYEKAAEQEENLNRGLRSGNAAAGKMLGTVKSIAATLGAAIGLNKLTDLSDQMTSTTARLSLMVDDGGSVTDLENKIMASAQRSRAYYLDTASAIASMGANAGSAFSSNDELIAFMEQVNKQFVIGGATAQGQSAAMLQLTQAMAAGALRGEELNSILENAPGIARAIESYMGVAEGSIKKYAQEGLITAEVVKNALFSVADETNAKFESMPMTWAQVWTNMQNKALTVLDPVLNKINQLANSDDFNTFANGAITAFGTLAAVLSGCLDLVVAVGSFMVDNWSWLGPIIGGVVTALLAYHGVMLAINTVEAIKAGLDAINAASTALKTGATLADAAATTTATGAQVGLNAALLACPVTWIVLGVIALVAGIIALCNWIAKTTGVASSFFGVITGGINVAIQAVKNAALVVANVALGIWSALGAVCSNIGTAFHNVIANVQGWFYGLLATALTVVEGICAALNKLPFVEFDYSGISAKADEYAAKSAEAYGSTEDYTSVADAFSEGFNTFDTFTDGWASDAFQAGAAWGDGIADKVGGMFDFDLGAAGDDYGGFALDQIAADTGNIADSTGGMADALEISNEQLEYMRDIAERDAINRFTTAEVKIDMTGMTNKIDGNADLDGVLTTLTDGFAEALVTAAEGVHE